MIDNDRLVLTIQPNKLWDERNDRFIDVQGGELILKHTLKSISKWESKWKKAYLKHHDDVSVEEALDYIRCMTINDVEPNIYYGLQESDLIAIREYIDDPMTATWFSEGAFASNKGKFNGEVVTAELVYYWMLSYQIPVSFDEWHFNRLMTLIKVFNVKSEKPKKKSKAEQFAEMQALNAKRRAKYHSKG